MIAVISDTHLPRGRRRLPDRCLQRLHDAELIIHAGDFVRAEVLERLEAIAPVAAVHGNVDELPLRERLPEARAVKLSEGVTIAVLHDAGARPGRLQRLRARFPDAAAVVFGHSHIPLHERDAEDGFQIFNPGSPTDRRRQPHHTMGLARVRGGRVEFELVELD